MNPYFQFVSEFSRLVRSDRNLPFGGVPPPSRVALPENAPQVLLFSPHPDDECLIGGLPLRLLRQSGMRVRNVPVTLGSNLRRRSARVEELTAACEWIQFELVDVRERDECGMTSVRALMEILEMNHPEVIFFPHDNDFNTTHIRTHRRVIKALEQLGNVSCWTVETEFWHPMKSPNLLVESSEQDLADLLTALSFHEGELQRNPYHLTAPAWFIDNVRRGSEVVRGQGAVAARFSFGTLYRLRRWERTGFREVSLHSATLATEENPTSLFGY